MGAFGLVDGHLSWSMGLGMCPDWGAAAAGIDITGPSLVRGWPRLGLLHFLGDEGVDFPCWTWDPEV